MHDKSAILPRMFRENIVRQLHEEMNRGVPANLGKSPQDVEQYIYDSTSSKDEYLEKIGTMIIALKAKKDQQQQQQQQQQHNQQMQGPYVARFPGQMQQGQFVQQMQYQQHPQQQPGGVMMHPGQGSSQMLRQPGYRQMPPEHVVSLPGQPPYRPGMRPGMMPGQPMGNQGQMMGQRQQFQSSMPPVVSQPNISMGQASNIVLGPQQRRGQPLNRPDVPQVQVSQPSQVVQRQQQIYQQQQQQQFQHHHHQQQLQQQHMMQNQGPTNYPPTSNIPNMPPQQPYVTMPNQNPPQSGLPRQSRSFNAGIASPAVPMQVPQTGPSPLGPKGGPGSVGPVSAMSPAMIPHNIVQPHSQTAPQQSPMSQPEVKPPVTEARQHQQPQHMVPPNASVTSHQSTTPEEISEKLKQLAKYKEPLRRVIEQYENHKENQSATVKMKRILDIISGQGSDSVSMSMLKRCEDACIQVVARFEPSVTQMFANALTTLMAAENIQSQTGEATKGSVEAFYNVANRAFGNISIDSNRIDSTDLGPAWGEQLQNLPRTATDSECDISKAVFEPFSHLSKAAQRELLFLSEKYDISCRSSATSAGQEESSESNELIALDFVPALRYLMDAGAPSICFLIPPNYPESPEIPQINFAPACELNPRLGIIKSKFAQMYDSVKEASVSDVSLVRLITLYESSVLSDL